MAHRADIPYRLRVPIGSVGEENGKLGTRTSLAWDFGDYGSETSLMPKEPIEFPAPTFARSVARKKVYHDAPFLLVQVYHHVAQDLPLIVVNGSSTHRTDLPAQLAQQLPDPTAASDGLELLQSFLDREREEKKS